jgi:hypothetical protein
MKRTLPILVALFLIIGSGFVHGLWTERWQPSTALDDAVARLQSMPGNLGEWTIHPQSIDPDQLTQAGAVGSWLCRYQSQKTHQWISVMLLCGRSGRMAVHRPETCYTGAGWELAGAPSPFPLTFSPDQHAEFLTGRFDKEAAGRSAQLRIFWSWHDGSTWQAPESPRWTFAHRPYLYKLYVIREITQRSDNVAQDPAVGFMKLLLPELTRRLHPGDH